RMHLNRGEIAELDADKDVTLEEVVAVTKGAKDDEPEPAELKEVIEVVTTVKLMTEVVTAAGMSYDDIRPIFEKHFNFIVGFLEKSEKELEEEASRELKRKSESFEQQAVISFRVDAVKDFKEFTLRDYYCWLKTYCYWYKLKLLDKAGDSRLRLLEQSVAADEKIKK
nr:hypothetical protein [Tanacetum cinerariifolium]